MNIYLTIWDFTLHSTPAVVTTRLPTQDSGFSKIFTPRVLDSSTRPSITRTVHAVRDGCAQLHKHKTWEPPIHRESKREQSRMYVLPGVCYWSSLLKRVEVMIS